MMRWMIISVVKPLPLSITLNLPRFFASYTEQIYFTNRNTEEFYVVETAMRQIMAWKLKLPWLSCRAVMYIKCLHIIFWLGARLLRISNACILFPDLVCVDFCFVFDNKNIKKRSSFILESISCINAAGWYCRFPFESAHAWNQNRRIHSI